ncbi:MAG: hypothetical protein L6V84_01865 [Oscillospiraceae bacterium]|nr:MAG: hypothetical protein L6V84_01865 [Oscillospiraceae bacterium]
MSTMPSCAEQRSWTRTAGNGKTVTLHVACGIRRPWPDGAVWTDAQKADFPGTPAGLEQAAAWLEERLAESDVGGGRIGV